MGQWRWVCRHRDDVVYGGIFGGIFVTQDGAEPYRTTNGWQLNEERDWLLVNMPPTYFKALFGFVPAPGSCMRLYFSANTSEVGERPEYTESTVSRMIDLED